MSDTSKIPARRIEGLEEVLESIQSLSFPDQTNNNGKFLSTDGENPSWKFPTIVKDVELSSEKGLSQLIINKLSQTKYDELLENNLIKDNELYITSDNKEYYTKEEVDNLIQNTDVPTKVSELENDSNYIQNIATGEFSLTLLGQEGGKTRATSVGYQAKANDYSTALGAWSYATGYGATSIGRGTQASANNSLSIGTSAQSSAPGAIALGAQARNDEEKTFKVSLSTNNDNTPAVDESTGLYTLLTSDGKIPNERLNLENYVTKSTTLAGYGITDAYTKEETDAMLDAKFQVVDSLPDNPNPNVFYFIKE